MECVILQGQHVEASYRLLVYDDMQLRRALAACWNTAVKCNVMLRQRYSCGLIGVTLLTSGFLSNDVYVKKVYEHYRTDITMMPIIVTVYVFSLTIHLWIFSVSCCMLANIWRFSNHSKYKYAQPRHTTLGGGGGIFSTMKPWS